MTTQPIATWLRASLPVSRSVPYFIPSWFVFTYDAALSVVDWPIQYLGISFALALLFALVPCLIHGMTLRQWAVTAGVLPGVATALLIQVIKLTTQYL